MVIKTLAITTVVTDSQLTVNNLKGVAAAAALLERDGAGTVQSALVEVDAGVVGARRGRPRRRCKGVRGAINAQVRKICHSREEADTLSRWCNTIFRGEEGGRGEGIIT